MRQRVKKTLWSANDLSHLRQSPRKMECPTFMTEGTRTKMIEEMIAQLKPKTEDEAGSNFEAHCDK